MGKSSNIITLSYTPKFPGALQSTTVNASSFQVNLDKTTITWYVDGQMKLTGLGKKSFTFTTGNVGNQSVIKISADAPSFGNITKEVTITPTDLDVLWEADTYVPPFYKGKALPSSQGSVRVVPFPSFVGQDGYYNSSNLVYKWKAGYFGNPNDSGYGKNIFIYKTGYTYNTDQIEVTVSTLDTGLSISKKVPIYVSEPKIVFYQNKPLEGMRFENSLGEAFRFTDKELTVRAAPFYFALPGLNNNTASFSWKIDGKKLETDPDNKTEFTFRKPEQGSGRFQLNLAINNLGYDLQTASKNVMMSYDN
jgi:hypothetical protein